MLESAYPDESSLAADEGTACHEVAAECLRTGAEPARFIGETINGLVFTDELAEMTTGYVETVRPLIASSTEYWIEHRVDFSSYIGVPESFGTVDLAVLYPLVRGKSGESYELFLVDLKTGYVFVEVDNNTQLLLYALGLYDELSLSYPITHIRLGIYQPKHGGLREWYIYTGDL